MKQESVCVMKRSQETAVMPRRAMAGGASERAVRPLSGLERFPVGSGLASALCRRVEMAGEEFRAADRGDLTVYLKRLRRWMRLREELTQALMVGGVL